MSLLQAQHPSSPPCLLILKSESQKELMTISSLLTPSFMTLYSVYFLYFLALFFWARRKNVEFVIDAQEARYILAGLVLYCLSNIVSKTLILLELKNESFEIINSHFLLFGIGFFLYFKLKKQDDRKNND